MVSLRLSSLANCSSRFASLFPKPKTLSKRVLFHESSSVCCSNSRKVTYNWTRSAFATPPSPELLTPLRLSLRSSIFHLMVLSARYNFALSTNFCYFCIGLFRYCLFCPATLHLHQLCLSLILLSRWLKLCENAILDLHLNSSHMTRSGSLTYFLLGCVYRGCGFRSADTEHRNTCLLVFWSPQYQEIWDLDEKDPFMRPEGGESVDDVVSRLTTAIESIEAEFQR